MTPDWIKKAADEIVLGFNKGIEKTRVSGKMPPPGSLTEFVRKTIADNAPAPEKPAPPPLKVDDMTPDNIYATKPPSASNTLLTSIKTAVETSPKPWRVGALADSLKTTKDAVTAAINAPGSGLTVSKPGWVRAA